MIGKTWTARLPCENSQRGQADHGVKRWDELTMLLRDELRMQSEYSKVAEYLDMAGQCGNL
jgi:hypothetical protein